ncbi:hypothetical protein C0585_07810 [Candidatus Woesearchaeota archaeon]|nr:MAG: hypothetical protein C0585_07810 [Candidatus Woesearchaeota archaeon]
MNIPNEIVLELTSECNMNCAFCFNPPKKKNMEINKIKKIIDDVSSSSIKAIRYTGGEVFLRDDLKDILSYSKSKGIYNIINTNGLLIKTPNIFDFIDLTLISFHDISKFDIIKEKLKIINKDVMLCTIMTEDNILNLDKYYECISKINSPFFKEWFLLRPVPNPKYKFPIKDKDLLFLFKEIKRLNEKFDMNIMIANSVPFCSIEKDISRYCKGGVFDSGHSRLYIDSSGKYRTDYFSKDIGDVETKKVLDIWGKTEPIRRYENLKKECFSCFYLEKCKGGLGKTDYLVDRKNIIPLISIIVPAFNDSKRLSLLVESLKEQSFSDFEVIIVDDGSNEKERLENKKIVENLDNDWISYYYLQNAKVFGASIARNYGAKKAKGRILIFLDQDCVAHKDLIKNHVDEQKAKDIILGYFAGYGSKK